MRYTALFLATVTFTGAAADDPKPPAEKEIFAYLAALEQDKEAGGANVPRGGLRVGLVFRPVLGRITVDKIVDEDNALATFRHNAGEREGDDGELESKFIDQDAWFVMPTSRFVEGQPARLEGVVLFVSGTRKYAVALGETRTVYTVEQLDGKRIADAAKAFDLQKAETAADGAAEARKKEFRTWTDVSGKYTLLARLEKFADGKAVLEREDGVFIAVREDRLSTEDRKWIEQELARRAGDESK